MIKCGWRAALWKRPWGVGRQWAVREPAACPGSSLGWINKSVACRWREGIIPLYGVLVDHICNSESSFRILPIPERHWWTGCSGDGHGAGQGLGHLACELRLQDLFSCRDGFWDATSSFPGLHSRATSRWSKALHIVHVRMTREETRGISWNQKEPGWASGKCLPCGDKRAVEHAAYRGCTGSVLGSFQNWTRQRLEQSCLKSGLACLNRKLEKEPPKLSLKRIILCLTVFH